MHVVEFTPDIPYYMSLADFFVGKPGPGSISEALAMKLRSSCSGMRGRFRRSGITPSGCRRSGSGWCAGLREVCEQVSHLLHTGRFAEFRANAAGVRNNAVFEILEILDGLMTPA
jgi:1,2-diacylglycerol 3-beta-galactosyltransferase